MNSSFSPFNSLEDTVKNTDIKNTFSEFFKRMKRKNEDCPEDDDCGEVRSPCCDIKVGIIFGSYPLEVKCANCGVKYRLRDVVL